MMNTPVGAGSGPGLFRAPVGPNRAGRAAAPSAAETGKWRGEAPMRTVAFIGDIHGNLPALEAVLDHARRRGVDEIWNAGDSVGYGPFPREVLERLRDEDVASIAGNYDRKVLKVPKKLKKWRRTKRPMKLLALLWAHDRMGRANRDCLASLPAERRLGREGTTALLTHGSPDSAEEGLTPATPLVRLEELAGRADADLVACGHSHVPMVREAGGVLFVNSGGTGRPVDGDPRAGYAVVTLGDGRPRAEVHRVAYDFGRLRAEIARRRLPAEFGRMFAEARNLEDLATEY